MEYRESMPDKLKSFSKKIRLIEFDSSTFDRKAEMHVQDSVR